MLRKILGTSLCVAVLIFTGSNASADLITDFSSGLTGFEPLVPILDVNGGANNTISAQANGSGQLELNTTAFDAIEQYALIYTATTTLHVDLTALPSTTISKQLPRTEASCL